LGADPRLVFPRARAGLPRRAACQGRRRALEAIDRAARDGEDLTWLCREVVETARRALVVKVAPDAPFADLTPADHEALGRERGGGERRRA